MGAMPAIAAIMGSGGMPGSPGGKSGPPRPGAISGDTINGFILGMTCRGRPSSWLPVRASDIAAASGVANSMYADALGWPVYLSRSSVTRLIGPQTLHTSRT